MSEATLHFEIEGISPLIMHSDRLVNPIDPAKLEIAKLTGLKKKTPDVYEQIARLEFLAGLYIDAEAGPYIPAINVERLLRDSAAKWRAGKDVVSCVMVMDDKIKLVYDGPRQADKLADTPRFRDFRSVVLQRARVMRCRPIFMQWSAAFDVWIDDTDIVEPAKVKEFIEFGGKRLGLCDFRPRFGRFKVTKVS